MRAEDPMTVEVAVTPEGNVSINIQHLPVGADGWGHLTFNVPQAIEFIKAFEGATLAAYGMTQEPGLSQNKMN